MMTLLLAAALPTALLLAAAVGYVLWRAYRIRRSLPRNAGKDFIYPLY